MLSFDNTEIAFQSKSNKDLQRAYWLFKLVGNNTLVRMGPSLLNMALFLRLPIMGLIKSTIFKHFCGGESIADSQATIDELGQYRIGTILDYSVEGKESESDFDAGMEETMATIQRAAGDANIPFSVFKVTGMARFGLLEKVNAKKPLTEAETQEYERVKERINKICQTAFELEVPIFIDAEESWIQDPIDELCTEMMTKYNKEKAVIYNTLQMYRWDRLDFLKKSHQHATDNNYFLGLKLVRGAYMEKERERAAEYGYPSPIQKDKDSSDKDYDLAVAYCIEHIDQIALCAGTHNEESCRKLAKLLTEKNISIDDSRVYFSQLLGMSDNLSYNLAHQGYRVSKYVPYGPVKEVLPYLIRRAEENTSIAGQTGRELSLIMQERNRRKN
jgi:proline dehydrogenase